MLTSFIGKKPFWEMKSTALIIFLIITSNVCAQSIVGIDSMERQLVNVYDDYRAELTEFKEIDDVPKSEWKNYSVSQGKLHRYLGPNKKTDSLIESFDRQLRIVLASTESWSFDFENLKTRIRIDSIDINIRAFSFSRRLSKSGAEENSTLLQVKTEGGLKVFELNKELHFDEIDIENNLIRYSIHPVTNSSPKKYLLVGEYLTSGSTYVISSISVGNSIQMLPIFNNEKYLFVETSILNEYIVVLFNKYDNSLDVEIWEGSGTWNPQPTGKEMKLIWNGEQFNTVANNVHKR